MYPRLLKAIPEVVSDFIDCYRWYVIPFATALVMHLIVNTHDEETRLVLGGLAIVVLLVALLIIMHVHRKELQEAKRAH